MANILKISSGATMPHLCAKCGVGGEHDAREHTFHYRPIWARLLGRLGVMWERTATFYFWLCPRCNTRWKWAMPLSIVAFLGGVAAWFLGANYVLPLVLHATEGVVSLIIGLGYFLMFIPMLYALDFGVERFVRWPLVVTAKKIDASGMVSLRGVHPDVIAAVTPSS